MYRSTLEIRWDLQVLFKIFVDFVETVLGEDDAELSL